MQGAGGRAPAVLLQQLLQARSVCAFHRAAIKHDGGVAQALQLLAQQPQYLQAERMPLAQ